MFLLGRLCDDLRTESIYFKGSFIRLSNRYVVARGCRSGATAFRCGVTSCGELPDTRRDSAQKENLVIHFGQVRYGVNANRDRRDKEKN